MAFSCLMILVLCGSAAAAEMPDNNYVNLEVVNDNGARIDIWGNDTYRYFEGTGTGGTNSLKINDDNGTAAKVINTTAQSGTFYIAYTGGQGRVDNGILMLAVNGTVPDDFQVTITANGYTWNPAIGFTPAQGDLTYNPVTLNETFYKSDFIYGPQTWKPYYQANYPIYEKQDMTNTSNAFYIMLIDLYSGIIPGANYDSLINNGAIKVQYSFQNLPLGSIAVFNAYGFSTTPESGSTNGSVQYTNRVNTALTTSSGASGYTVISNIVATGGSYTISEDSALGGIITATDADGDTLTYTLGDLPNHGTAIVNSGNGMYQYEPDDNWNGVDTFTVIVSDGKGSTATATVTITVNPVNDAPVANNDTVTTDENTSIIVDVKANDSDVEGDTLTVTGVTQPSNGLVTLVGGVVTYTPNNNYNGPDSFIYTISDGKGGTATATVTVTVNSVNNVPVATGDSQTTNEDTPVSGSVTATDADGDTLTFSKGTGPSNGSVTVNADGTYTYTPNTNWNGLDTFTVIVNDGNGGTEEATVTITVNAVNDAPVANNDSATTKGDKAVNIDVNANDSDVDDDTLTVTGVSDPAHGTATVNANGTITYTPDANYYGSDSFTYTVSDVNGGTATATVNITVQKATASIYVNTLVSKNNPTVGETITLTFKLGNNGPDAADDVVFTYVIPEGMEFVSLETESGYPEAVYDPATRTITWNLGTVPVLDPWLNINVRVLNTGTFNINPTVTVSGQNVESGINSILVNAVSVSNTVNAATETSTVPMQATGIPLAGLTMALLLVCSGIVLARKK